MSDQKPQLGAAEGRSKESVPGSQGEALRDAPRGPVGLSPGAGGQQLVPMAPGSPDPTLVDGKQAPASCGRQPRVCPASGPCTLESPGLQLGRTGSLGAGAPHSGLLTGGSVWFI